MTSIRALLDNHTPIQAVRVPSNPQLAMIETADFNELCEIAGTPGPDVFGGDVDHVLILILDLQMLVQQAHEKLHGHPSVEEPEEQEDYSFETRHGDPEPEPEEREVYRQEAQFRNVAMHYAVQVATAEISASHGLDVSPGEKLISTAEKILTFLKG